MVHVYEEYSYGLLMRIGILYIRRAPHRVPFSAHIVHRNGHHRWYIKGSGVRMEWVQVYLCTRADTMRTVIHGDPMHACTPLSYLFGTRYVHSAQPVSAHVYTEYSGVLCTVYLYLRIQSASLTVHGMMHVRTHIVHI